MTWRERISGALRRMSAFLRSPAVRHEAGFVVAVLGVVLVAITPNPPETPLHWIQIVGGASLTSFFATAAGRREVRRRWPPGLGARFTRWLLRKRVAVGVAVVLAAVLAFGVPPAWELARGSASTVFGCSPATQLRMVAGPETVTTARKLTSGYERWTAGDNHGCPTVGIYVYQGPVAEIRDRVRTVDGWSDASGALGEIGPRPDIWLATTSHELDGLDPQPGRTAIAESMEIARSPLVLAVPEPLASQDAGPAGSWSELLRDVTEQGVGVVRADPGSTELGLLATALLYGPLDLDEPSSPLQLTSVEIEQRIASSLDGGGYPLTDIAGVLCHQRLLGAPDTDGVAPQPGSSAAAVIASEQQVALFNLGDPLGASCITRTDEPRRLVALYPSDTHGLDHQFVRLAWSDPPQEEAAAGFGEWLRSDPGRAAIVRTGLRPVGAYTIAHPLTELGIDPGAKPAIEPIPADRWGGTTAAYDMAQRRGRVLFALDTSGSMAAAGPEGNRSAVAASAVSAALRDMGPRDEFGLWFFPDRSDTGHVEAVPLGPRELARLDAAQGALDDVVPAGNTPLFRTIIDGAQALSPDDPAQVNAVVVLTDGADTTSGLGADAVRDALAGSGVRVIVVTIGEIRCSDNALRAVTTATAGECLDANLSNLDATLGTAVARLWGGR